MTLLENYLCFVEYIFLSGSHFTFYMYLKAYKCIYTYIHICICICVCVYVYSYMYMYMYVCMCMCICISVCAYVYVYVYMYMYMLYIYIYIYIIVTRTLRPTKVHGARRINKDSQSKPHSKHERRELKNARMDNF